MTAYGTNSAGGRVKAAPVRVVAGLIATDETGRAQPFCPNCGLDLQKQDRFIERGPWKLAVDHAQFGGDWMRAITPQMAGFLHTLAIHPEWWVGATAMGERIARDPDAVTSPRTLASVIAFNLRKLLGEDAPFISDRQRGYRWKDAG